MINNPNEKGGTQLKNKEKTKRTRDEEIFSQGKRRRRSGRREKNPGALLGALFRISDGFERAYKGSIAGHFFNSLYARLNESWERGAIRRLLHRKRSGGEKRTGRARQSVAGIYESSLISRIITGLSDRIVNSRVRVWGVFLFVFAFLTIFMAMLKYFLISDIMWVNIVIGIMIALLAIPLLVSNKRLGPALLEGRTSGYVMNTVLSVDESRFEGTENGEGVGYPVVLALSGILGMLTYLISPIYIIALALMLAIITAIMCFPELGIMATLVAIPFTSIFERPSLAVMALICITLAGYISKLLRGKRVLRLTLVDVLVAIFALLLLFGGICTGGGAESFKTAIMYFGFLTVYFLIVNSYIRKTWIYRGLKLIVISTGIVAMLGIFEDGILDKLWADMSVFSDLGASISAFLGNPNMLGAYLVIVFPIALGEAMVSRGFGRKLWYAVCSLAIFGCIVMTWSLGAWLGILIAFVCFLLSCDSRAVWLAVGAAASAPAWGVLVPDTFVRRLANIVTVSDSSVLYRLNTWQGVLRMIGDHLLSGVGVGEEAFKSAYILYAVSGTESVSHSGSLYLQILLELGIVGTVVLALILVMLLQICSSEVSELKRGSKTRIMISAGLSGIVGALVMGITDHIWYDYRVFLIFWAVAALTVALARINEKERKKELAGISNNAKSVELEII